MSFCFCQAKCVCVPRHGKCLYGCASFAGSIKVLFHFHAGHELNSVKAQLDLAERQLREYQREMEKGTAVFLGDPSDFQKMLAFKESSEDASFMGMCLN